LPKRDPTETAFSLKNKKSAGEISKNMQRLFLVGRSGQTCPLGGGAWFTLRAGNGF